MSHDFVPEDEVRDRFSQAMSEMYRAEVPQCGTLMELVEEVNGETLMKEPALLAVLNRNDEPDRLSVERHGAIRLGTPEELFNIRRVFAVMGMYPVGYYDLSAGGIPVHSTAFRPVDDEALGTDARQNYSERSNRLAFENALGSAVQDKLKLYANAEQRSLEQTFGALGHPELAFRSFSE